MTRAHTHTHRGSISDLHTDTQQGYFRFCLHKKKVRCSDCVCSPSCDRVLYLRRPVLVVPYPLFHQPHQRRNVVELGLLQNTWRKIRKSPSGFTVKWSSVIDLNVCGFYLPLPGFYPWSVSRAAGNSGWAQSMWGPCRSGRLLSRPVETHQQRRLKRRTDAFVHSLRTFMCTCSGSIRGAELLHLDTVRVNVSCHQSGWIFHAVSRVSGFVSGCREQRGDHWAVWPVVPWLTETHRQSLASWKIPHCLWYCQATKCHNI